MHVYATILGKKQRVRQYVICKKNELEWLINMLSCLSFKPYAKSIFLCVILVSPFLCIALRNEATPSHDIP